ncbi:hypothetical protein OAS39_04355 [Pirellulales bacterium]|nr:hypothetical protein [Pirellulales bacterium]
MAVIYASRVGGDDSVSFRRDIAPIFINHCLSCHAADRAEGGYRVDNYDVILQEGDSGIAGILPSEVAESEVVYRVELDDADMRMPLEGEPLSAREIGLLRRWVEEGARYDANNQSAPLTSILPIIVHPPPPSVYPGPWPVAAVASDPGEGQIYVGGYHEVTVWNQQGKLVRRLTNLPERIASIQLAPNGKWLAVAGGQPGRMGDVRLVDASSGEVSEVVLQTAGVVLDVAWSPDGDRLAVAAADRSVRVYAVDSETGGAKLEFRDQTHSDWVSDVSWDDSGERLATSSRDGTAKVLDAQTGRSIVSYLGHAEPVRSAAFAADGEHVFSVSASGLHRWKIDDGQPVGDPIKVDGELLAMTRLDEHLVIATDAPVLLRINAASGDKEGESVSLGHRPLCVAGADQPGRYLVGTLSGRVLFCDWGAGKVETDLDAAPKEGQITSH